MPTHHEDWRSLPEHVRIATIEIVAELEKRIVVAQKATKQEKKLYEEIRVALAVAVGVLKETTGHFDPIGPFMKPSRQGNA